MQQCLLSPVLPGDSVGIPGRDVSVRESEQKEARTAAPRVAVVFKEYGSGSLFNVLLHLV